MVCSRSPCKWPRDGKITVPQYVAAPGCRGLNVAGWSNAAPYLASICESIRCCGTKFGHVLRELVFTVRDSAFLCMLIE